MFEKNLLMLRLANFGETIAVSDISDPKDSTCLKLCILLMLGYMLSNHLFLQSSSSKKQNTFKSHKNSKSYRPIKIKNRKSF